MIGLAHPAAPPSERLTGDEPATFRVTGRQQKRRDAGRVLNVRSSVGGIMYRIPIYSVRLIPFSSQRAERKQVYTAQGTDLSAGSAHE